MALANKVAHIVFALMTKGGQYATGRSPPWANRLFDRSFRRQGDRHRGARRSDVSERKRLGSRNDRVGANAERERMIGRRAMRIEIIRGRRRDHFRINRSSA